MKRIRRHFSRIARKYADLRTTDLEPILSIKKKLRNLNEIDAADVGCGGGRYDIKLFHHLGKRIHLTCIDNNGEMLDEIPMRLKSIKYFKYKRTTELKWLITQATGHHYSTFYLYDEREFEDALKKFRENIINHFKNPDEITWYDENVMLIGRK